MADVGNELFIYWRDRCRAYEDSWDEMMKYKKTDYMKGLEYKISLLERDNEFLRNVIENMSKAVNSVVDGGKIDNDSEEYQAALKLQPIDFDMFSTRVSNALKLDNLKIIGDITILSVAEMLRIPNFGCKSVKETLRTIQRLGVKLTDDQQRFLNEK